MSGHVGIWSQDLMAKTAELVPSSAPQLQCWEMGLRSGSQEDYDDVLYKVVEDKDWQGTIEDHCKKDCYWSGTGNVWKCMEVLKWALHIFERGAFMSIWISSCSNHCGSSSAPRLRIILNWTSTSLQPRTATETSQTSWLWVIFVEPWWSMVIHGDQNQLWVTFLTQEQPISAFHRGQNIDKASHQIERAILT